MRIGIFSTEGGSVWMAARLQDEGHNVLMYHAPPIENAYATPPDRHSGEDITPLAKTWDQFVAWRPDLVIFDCSDYGKRADALRRSGTAVFGSAAFYDKMEKDREFGIALAERIGIAVPEHHGFTTISDAIAWLTHRPADEKWYFKTDRNLGPAYTAGGDKECLTARLKYVRANVGDRVKHILQRAIDGADLMTAGYFNGHTFVPPFEGTLERKEFGNDDTGPKTGCAANVVWFYDDIPKIVEDLHFDALGAVLRHVQCPPCIIDCNVVVEEKTGTPYFLEWTPRLGIDSEPTATRLLVGEYAEFISRLCEGTLPMVPFSMEGAAYAIRLSVPPYPYEPRHTTLDERHTPIGLPLIGVAGSLWGEKRRDRFIGYSVRAGADSYECSDPFGLIGIASAAGDDLEKLNAACVSYARGLGVPDLGYRTDGAAALRKDLAAVRRAGYRAPVL